MGTQRYIGVYRVYSTTRVNMGKVSLGKTWVHRIYRGIQGIQYYLGKHGYTKIYRGIQGIQYY